MAAKRKNKHTGKSGGTTPTGNALSLSALGKNWQDKSPILKYLLGFVLLLVLFYAVYISPFFETWFLMPVLNLQTAISSFFLNLIGQGTIAEGAMLGGPQASLNVAKGCDGMEAMALYLIGVLLMPFTWRSKGVGLLLGAGVLFVLNLIRIIGLYLAKVYWPSAFDTLHIHGGFALFTVVAILLWFAWAGWAIRKEKPAADVPA